MRVLDRHWTLVDLHVNDIFPLAIDLVIVQTPNGLDTVGGNVFPRVVLSKLYSRRYYNQ